MLNLGESGLCGSCCNQASSKSVKKEPLSEGANVSCPEWLQAGDTNNPENKSAETPERSQSIATRYWHEQSPTKNDTDRFIERIIEGLVCNASTNVVLHISHVRCIHHCCLSEQRLWLHQRTSLFIFKPNLRMDSQFDSPMACVCSGKIKSTTQLASIVVIWVSRQISPIRCLQQYFRNPKSGVARCSTFYFL